jgi:hypothetical protein
MDYSSTIISVLKNHDIEYWEWGKNVSQDSINIQCPFCGDHSNHCGIFRDSLVYHCWRCNAVGRFDFLVAYIIREPVETVQEEVESFGITFDEDSVEQIRQLFQNQENKSSKSKDVDISSIQWPEYCEPVTYELDSPLLDQYLERRNLDRGVLIDHQCGVCTVGPYMGRLIVPVFYGGELCSYQAADLTGQAYLKYQTASNNINDYLYRWDMVVGQPSRFVVLVEGVVDAWRIQGSCLATFGTSLTRRQQKLLVEGLEPSMIILCWDGDAWVHAYRTADQLRPYVDHVGVVELPVGHDPDSFGYENTWGAIERTIKEVLE